MWSAGAPALRFRRWWWRASEAVENALFPESTLPLPDLCLFIFNTPGLRWEGEPEMLSSPSPSSSGSFKSLESENGVGGWILGKQKEWNWSECFLTFNKYLYFCQSFKSGWPEGRFLRVTRVATTTPNPLFGTWPTLNTWLGLVVFSRKIGGLSSVVSSAAPWGRLRGRGRRLRCN
jgi:hypothetical protein